MEVVAIYLDSLNYYLLWAACFEIEMMLSVLHYFLLKVLMEMMEVVRLMLSVLRMVMVTVMAC